MSEVLFIMTMQIRTLKQNHLDVFASSSENQYLLKNVFRRTMPDIHEYFQPIEDTIANKFITVISGGHFVNDVERKLISLSTRYRGLAIPIIKDIAKMEYVNSRRITEELALSINNQNLSYNVDTSNK